MGYYKILGLVAGLAIPAALPAFAQDYPLRTVTVVVPAAAGSAQDVVGRLIAERLSAKLGQQFIISNRAGASSNIGNAFVSRATPDGYTLLLSNTLVALYPAMFKNLTYDPFKDFVNIAAVSKGPAVLFSAPSFPAKDMKEAVELSKRDLKGLDYGTTGIGTIHHLAVEVLKQGSGANFTMIPYNEAPKLVIGVIGGQVSFASLTLGSIKGQIDSGAIKPLAILQTSRSPLVPNIPTTAELGLPSINASVQFYFAAPEATPTEIVKKLETAIQQIVLDPSLKEPYTKLGFEQSFLSSADTTQAMKDWAAVWGPIIKAANISLD